MFPSHHKQLPHHPATLACKDEDDEDEDDEDEDDDDDYSDIMVSVNIVDWLPTARPASCHHTRDIDSIFYPNITIANVIIIIHHDQKKKK